MTSPTTITIGAVAYNSYLDVAAADDYLAADMKRADTWDGLTDTVKGRALITASRYLDRQKWQGTASVDGQAMAWPRSGALDLYGATVADDTVPQAIQDATAVLAYEISQDPELQDAISSGREIKSMMAGSVQITWFKATFDPKTKLPYSIADICGFLLSGRVSRIAPYASGTDYYDTNTAGHEITSDDDFSVN